MTTDTTTLAAHLATMLDVAPRDWWRFVGCDYCMALRGQGCVQGYDGWPNPAREPHAIRRRAGQVLYGTIWLLANHPGDVLGESADYEGAGGAVSDEQAAVGRGDAGSAERGSLTTCDGDHIGYCEVCDEHDAPDHRGDDERADQ